MTPDKNGLPLHTDDCPENDGKRCRSIGFRPDRFCEPALIKLQARLNAAIEGLGMAKNLLCVRCNFRYGMGPCGDVCVDRQQIVDAFEKAKRNG